MDNQTNNIDKQFRDKFENFAPAPPEHIWEGVRGGIVTGTSTSVFAAYWKQIAAAASIILLVGLGGWWLSLDEDTTELNGFVEESNEVQSEETEVTIEESQIETAEASIDETVIEQDDLNTIVVEEDANEIAESDAVSSAGNQLVHDNLDNQSPIAIEAQDVSDNTDSQVMISETSEFGAEAISLGYMTSLETGVETELTPVMISKPLDTPLIPASQSQAINKGWSHAVYFTPEFVLNDLDSVTVLPSYSLNYEPTYKINDHWFVRFGIGMNYARDRGFAKIDLIQNEVIGSYTDVYDVKFDSIDGELVPIYFTQETDVWDSVRRVYVSEVTNKYLYVQVPALFGYYKKENRFNWYFYGGPAVNILVSKWIQDPQDEYGHAEIIDLQNKLPERAPYNFQLWLGAGIEYKIANQLAFAIEPNYRYYFNQVYKNDTYKKGLSGFAIRVGLVFSVK